MRTMLLTLAVLASLAFVVPSIAAACDGGYGGIGYYGGPGHYPACRPSYGGLYRGYYGGYDFGRYYGRGGYDFGRYYGRGGYDFGRYYGHGGCGYGGYGCW